MAGPVVGRGHAAVGAGDLHVKLGIGDLLADHLADAHGAEGRVGDHKGDLAAGGKPGRDAGAVLLRDAHVQILLRELLAKVAGLAALADVDIHHEDVPVFLAEFYDSFPEAVAGRNLFRFHAQASSLI